ncbi:putative NAD dependent epimerase/dehydratase family protein [Lyophyllum shimeji]|uniref:NAD dependent epimerase/dehydratase family protein n=1 Tax=Lyophyllum shimeji TaxID=47721 RepID=A0A9P3PG99_LYOSH|nr:putative NAD dependent epimerase/dehydratase family protein [Lyophyllum shimeji]
MNLASQKILVIGGNGFIGSAVCKAALAKGMQVTSVSSSGRPYRTAKDHTPAWVSKVDWQKGDALQPETFAHLFPEVSGVVHTLGTLIEDGKYKEAVKQGDVVGLVSSFCGSVTGDRGNPLEKTNDGLRRGTYEIVNRDAALRVCEAFISSSPSADTAIRNIPRPFVYISAEDIFRPIIPARYIETKREAEQGIEALVAGKPDYRGVYIRPSLVYHAHHRPLTTPAAVLLDLSATLHSKVPPTLPTPSSVLRHLASTLPFTSLQSIANALSIPPIHVDHVAEAICAALDSSSNPIRGVVGRRSQRDLEDCAISGRDFGLIVFRSWLSIGLNPFQLLFSPTRSMQSMRLARSSAKSHIQKPVCRSIGYSAASRRALPFFLNTKRGNDDQEHDQSRLLRMLMFGKPGAGKGTLTARLVEKYDIQSLSTGDLLRQHIAERTEVGREAEETVARGGLLPDELVLKVVTSKLDALYNKHWILDGFPRTLGQATLLDNHLKKKNNSISLVVNIDVPDDVIMSRISDRWVHLPSGRVYNMSYNRPKVEGYDDVTGEPLTKRPDDNPEVFARRLSQFYASTSPLLQYYTAAARSSVEPARHPHQHPHQLSFHRPQPKLKFRTLSGATSDENWPHLDSLVRNAFPTLKERAASHQMRARNSLSDPVFTNNAEAGVGFRN